MRCAELDREHVLLASSLAHDISVLDHIRISHSPVVHSVVEIFGSVATFLAGRSIQGISADLVLSDSCYCYFCFIFLVRVPLLPEFGEVCSAANISATEKRATGRDGLGRSEYGSRAAFGLEGAEQSGAPSPAGAAEHLNSAPHRGKQPNVTITRLVRSTRI